MWLMLQQEEPEDFVIATGETHSVQEFVEKTFAAAGLDWEEYVEISEEFYRPAEVNLLIGDPTKAKEKLGWSPDTSIDDLVEKMVNYDL